MVEMNLSVHWRSDVTVISLMYDTPHVLWDQSIFFTLILIDEKIT